MGVNKLGLALEGGSMRGMFTAGVLDVFMENGIRFDVAAGVSAGAVFGCNIKSEQVGRAIRYNKRFCRDKRYASLGNLLRTGNLFEVDFCYNKVVNELDVFDTKAFAENPMQFYAVCTDAHTGEAVYHLCENGDAEDVLWLRASAALPGMSRPVMTDDKTLFDGGIADSIPLRFIQKQGCDKSVAVLTQPRGYQKEPMRALYIVRLLLRKYPNVVTAVKNRWRMYNETLEYIAEQEQKGAVYVICPSEPLNIKAVERNPEELERVYQLGRKEAEEHIDEIHIFSGQNP